MTFMTRTIVVDDDDPTIEEDWRIFSSLGSPNRISNKLPFQTGGNDGPISEHYTNTTTTIYLHTFFLSLLFPAKIVIIIIIISKMDQTGFYVYLYLHLSVA